MKFLVIAQDLRITGTSEGIVSRSFIAKLRFSYPKSIINLHYLKNDDSNHNIVILPVDDIKEHTISKRIPFYIKWMNKVYWRFFNRSLNDEYIVRQYTKRIEKINYSDYDAVFIRSSGLNFENILAVKDLPILKKAIINFHDPYPILYDTSSKKVLNKLELYKYYDMWEIIHQAKGCMTPSKLLSKDLQFLYGSDVHFYTLPHQYVSEVFDLTDSSKVRKKKKAISISYHGGLQFGRNLDTLLDAFAVLIKSDDYIRENVEMVFRLKSGENNRLIKKYEHIENIFILDGISFSNSAFEQRFESDIIILLESFLEYSNILIGKAPFVASLHKPILALLPNSCELRNIISNEKFIAKSNDILDIQNKLKNLIMNFDKMEKVNPFRDYFNDENFKKMLDVILY